MIRAPLGIFGEVLNDITLNLKIITLRLVSKNNSQEFESFLKEMTGKIDR